MYIVGIDIAKRKHEAAVIDGEGAVIIKPFSFTNNCSGYNRLLAMLTKAKLPLDEVSFAMEATGHYWLALFTRLQKEGFRVQVINPVQTNSIRSFYIRQAKTDPRDALLIAEVIRFGHFSESTLKRIVKDFLIKFTKSSHLTDFITKHTLDFVRHRLCCGLAEMDTHDIGGLVDGLAETRLCVSVCVLNCCCVH